MCSSHLGKKSMRLASAVQFQSRIHTLASPVSFDSLFMSFLFWKILIQCKGIVSYWWTAQTIRPIQYQYGPSHQTGCCAHCQYTCHWWILRRCQRQNSLTSSLSFGMSWTCMLQDGNEVNKIHDGWLKLESLSLMREPLFDSVARIYLTSTNQQNQIQFKLGLLFWEMNSQNLNIQLPWI